MKIETIKEIENHINFLLETYDVAVMEKDHKAAAMVIDVINYELAKLEDNEIQVLSQELLN